MLPCQSCILSFLFLFYALPRIARTAHRNKLQACVTLLMHERVLLLWLTLVTSVQKGPAFGGATSHVGFASSPVVVIPQASFRPGSTGPVFVAKASATSRMHRRGSVAPRGVFLSPPLTGAMGVSKLSKVAYAPESLLQARYQLVVLVSHAPTLCPLTLRAVNGLRG